ncbi:MAG TPA: hypothetical protein PK747_10055 [Acidobacteriota bacterium]|nr:hypothetical protein [Acidobacteriota bacterium]HNT17882.1 hypothetical protein [Acidobacteriota bacterium]HPA27549.1 hypothetical protein [Acidobacteriota bacterium]HQO20377.1 hypothetical protein [Acidobacteriota bacterium]HQQ47732.1 hypothetical protein [Acidobacteriota bacterium]
MSKKIFFLTLLCVLAVLPLRSEIKLVETEDHKFAFYGFFQFDAAYQTFMMNSYTAPRYPLPNTINNDDATTNFTAMSSRFGVKWQGPTVFGSTKVNGCLEWDLFDGTSRNQMKFRTRLAYFELKGDGYSVIAGQHWDLFAAGLPNTLITNGFYWETGNMGFRRAQIRYTRFWDNGEFAISAGDPTTDNAIKNGTPLLNARYAFKFGDKKGHVALSAAYGQEDFKLGDYPGRIDDSVDIWGISIDAKVPVTDNFFVLGEMTRGQNLKTFLSRSYSYYDAVEQEYRGMDVTAGWLELLYSGSKVDCYLGYATERLTDEEDIPDGGLEDDDAYFFGLVHKLGKGVSYGVEITKFIGDYKETEQSHATQVLFSMKYAF